MIHDTVIDTSVVFPHARGPPYKKALRTLCGEILQKIIQNDGTIKIYRDTFVFVIDPVYVSLQLAAMTAPKMPRPVWSS